MSPHKRTYLCLRLNAANFHYNVDRVVCEVCIEAVDTFEHRESSVNDCNTSNIDFWEKYVFKFPCFTIYRLWSVSNLLYRYEEDLSCLCKTLKSFQKYFHKFNLLATDFLFQILAHLVFKMWVIQKPNKVALWNKRHFEGGNMEIIQHV